MHRYPPCSAVNLRRGREANLVNMFFCIYLGGSDIKVCACVGVFCLFVCLACSGKWTHFEKCALPPFRLSGLNRRNSAPSPAHAPGARLTARAHFVAALP